MSAQTQTIIDFQSSTTPEVPNSSSSYKSSLEAIRSRHSQELIIGLCGAIGAGVKRLKTTVINELKQANYHVEHIRLSELIANTQPNTSEILALDGFDRYDTLQNLGDKLRKDHSDTTVAEMGIRRIGLIRNTLFGNGNESGTSVKVTKKVAYVVDQIKHHKEVELFQEVYRNNFYLIGLLRTQSEREKNLKEEGITDTTNIASLVERDRNSNDKYGQHVEKAIQMADYFIRNLDETEELQSSIKRFINLIHGVGNTTPKRDEKGLYAAFSASLASACLSRQVGAAIMDDMGQIIATGCNDVPKFKGGLYDSDSKSDKRCFNKNGCQNDKHKLILKKQISSILKEEGVENPELIADKIFNNSKAKSLIEYSRAIHAEMDAIISLARHSGSSSVGKTLYCTTYPCHNCARHIVAAGIERVVYIEPYEKSLAMDLHDDAICHIDNKSSKKLLLQNFEGVSPNRYAEFFIYNKDRKDNDGNVKHYELPTSSHVDPHQLDCYVDYEVKVAEFADDTVGEDNYTPS
ncbi:anti-phage dCTP deaminase [Vibrio vulnificus]|uniref:anti-phage dCTP deaminase n=1 Tax=Vibrio vulnificus TaxID=672 RepID=UPI0009275A46|nr:anti-phage dCTP deaminase [Vibrio vulnificus]OJI54331.1 tRNA-specific adenosine deaminase [Vibrio vulnificus]OJI55299.1 tRNA-specific adenosine deaminase [Vibrio fluvialis]POB23989.1 deoxycytidylate deaminase [Vibrio vulnificus]